MSTPFYDLASLVLVPSGYKAQKVYAQKPLTTDGQLAFSRASTATRVNASGLIETVSSNVPRLDYLNSSCPRLLLEPQRSNLITYSEQANNAAWTKRNSTISANSATSPDGYTNADKIQEDTTNDRHDIYQEFSVTSGTAYTISAFVKAAERTFCFLSFGSSNVNANNAFFNLSTGAVVSSPAGVTSTITSYGSGWYRITSTATASATGLAYVVNGPTLNASGISYQGVSGSGILVYGYGAEAGAYATSYIPTLGAAVTRLADACRKGSISSLIGSTEGTLFVEMQVNPVGESLGMWPRNSAAGLYGNFIYMGTNGSIQSRIQVVNAGAVQTEIIGSVLTPGWHKFALAYKANDFAFYVDGVLIGTSNSGAVPSGMNELYIDEYIDGGVRNASKKQALLFKTRLTNAQLAELTTL